MAALQHQVCAYRRGETAFLTLVLLRHRDWRTLGQIVLWIPWWRSRLFGGEVVRRLAGRKKFSFRVMWAESIAYLAGPGALWCGYRINRARRPELASNV
jgi:hypothetical protein